MKWFRQWLAKRKEKRDHDLYCFGFGWAMTEHFIGDLPIDEIVGCLEVAKRLNSYNQFDSGAEAAVEVIISKLESSDG